VNLDDVLAVQSAKLDRVIDRDGVAGILKVYDDARDEIWLRLKAQLRGKKGDSFQAHQLRLALAQVEQGLGQLVDKAPKLGASAGIVVNEQALGNLSKQIHLLERHYDGSSTPLAVDQIGQLSKLQEELRPTLLRRFDVSFRTYGAQTVQAVEQNLAVGLATKAPLEETIDRVKDTIEAERWKAERIVRTELIGTANNAAHEGLVLSRQQWPDLQKMWSAFADIRECKLCAKLDGTRRPIPNGTWQLRPGVFVAHAPAHPNCRCSILPMRAAWRN